MHNEKHISTFRILHYPPKLMKPKSLDDEERITLMAPYANMPLKYGPYTFLSPRHAYLKSNLIELCDFDTSSYRWIDFDFALHF